ncbi:MAG: GspH/FimT family pseudopilin [Candidatus Acidiferrum sp.]
MLSSLKRHAGFSLTELVVTLAVAMVLIAVGLPAFLRAYHSYELSNAANQTAGILRLTRYEAIRLNKSIDCIIQSSATNPGMTNLWADSNGNGLLDPTEKMILLGSSGNLVDGGGVPNTGGLIGSAVGSIATTAPSPAGSVVWFDARGAVIPPTNVNVFYLASSAVPEAGYRAVLLLPAGSIQIWTADVNGNWQQMR